MNNAFMFCKLAAAVCVLLFLGIAAMPYGYYTFLRIATSGASVFFLYLLWMEDKKSAWILIWGGIAILFNPIIQIHLSKDVWRIIDALTGLFFAYQATQQYKIAIKSEKKKMTD